MTSKEAQPLGVLGSRRRAPSAGLSSCPGLGFRVFHVTDWLRVDRG